MKKVLFLLCLFAAPALYAQWLETSADTEFFNERMCFRSSTKGIVVSFDGIYQRTYDGGITWDTGHIELDDWSLCARQPYQSNLQSVCFPSDTIGYIGGTDGDLFKSNDGGFTWRCISCTNCWDDLEDLYFFNNDTGLYSTWYGIYRTQDGGITWAPVQTGINPTRTTRVNDSTALVGGAKIRRSSDYGLTWAPTNHDTTIGFHDISMGDSLHGVAVAWAGKVIRTVDGGLNWTAPVQIASVRISNVEMINDSFGFISLGDSWTTNWQQPDIGYVMYTLDGGMTWIQPDTIGTKTLTDIEFPADSIGYGCGWHGNLLKTEHPIRPYSGVGVQEPVAQFNMVIFPNPARDVLNVFISGFHSTTPAAIVITDLSGRSVYAEQNFPVAPYQIDIAELPTGIYFLHCSANGIESVSKFIVQ